MVWRCPRGKAILRVNLERRIVTMGTLLRSCVKVREVIKLPDRLLGIQTANYAYRLTTDYSFNPFY